MEQTKKIPGKEKFGYVAAAAAMSVILMYVPQFITVYYTDVVGMAAAAIGTIMLATKVFDGISDIIMGWIIDRTNSKMGKARPWILAGGIGSGISLYLLFCVPEDMSEVGVIIFCTATYFLTCPFWGTVLSVAESAIVPMISSDGRNRTLLGLLHSFTLIFITILTSIVTPTIISSMGENRETYRWVTFAYAALTVIASVVGTVLIREHSTEEASGSSEKPVKMKESLGYLLHNKNFICLALGTIAYNTSLVTGANNYFAKYILGDLSYAAVGMLCQGGTYILLFFAMNFQKKFKMRHMIVFGFVVMAVGDLLTFFAGVNVPLFCISMVMRGFGMLPLLAFSVPLTGQVADKSLCETGKHMDGTIYAGFSMGGKIGTGLGGALVGWIIGIFGYVGTAEVQSQSALLAIRVVFSILPFVLIVIAAVCYAKIDVEEGREAVEKSLKERKLR